MSQSVSPTEPEASAEDGTGTQSKSTSTTTDEKTTSNSFSTSNETPEVKSKVIPKTEEQSKPEQITMEEVELFKKRMLENERMESIYRSKNNLAEKFDNRINLHPHGMTSFDLKIMPSNKLEQLEKYKHQIRKGNYDYLGQHYELDAILALFLRKLLQVKPLDTIHFAAEYFTKDIFATDFNEMVRKEKCQLSNYRVKKMLDAEKIMMRNLGPLSPVSERKYERCFKKERPCVSIEPTPTSTAKPAVIAVRSVPVQVLHPKKPYCGCKDLDRRQIAHPSQM